MKPEFSQLEQFAEQYEEIRHYLARSPPQCSLPPQQSRSVVTGYEQAGAGRVADATSTGHFRVQICAEAAEFQADHRNYNALLKVMKLPAAKIRRRVAAAVGDE